MIKIRRKDKSSINRLYEAYKNPSFMLDKGIIRRYVIKKYKFLFFILQLFARIPYLLISKNSKIIFSERLIELPFALTRISKVKKKKILDFGGSTSFVSLFLASLGHNVNVADMRPYEFSHPNISMKIGNILKTIKTHKKYDVIVAISSIEHAGMPKYVIDPNPSEDKEIMNLFNKILTKKGTIILTVPYGDAKKTTKRYRVYDSISLKRLCQNFIIKEKQYYKTTKGKWFLCNKYSFNRGEVGLACLVLGKRENS